MPLNKNKILLEFILVGLTLLLSGLFACMFFPSYNNTAFAQQQLQTLTPAQNITKTTDTNTLSLSGSATTMVKPDKVTVSLGRNN